MDSSKKIFAGALEPSVTQKDLSDLFSKFGKVKEASFLFGNNRNRNPSRGFEFVSFKDKKTVEQLVQENKFFLKGRKIDVKKHKLNPNKKQKIYCFKVELMFF